LKQTVTNSTDQEIIWKHRCSILTIIDRRPAKGMESDSLETGDLVSRGMRRKTMKYRTVISILVASILAFTSLSSYAGQGQHGNAGADRGQQADRDRSYDRDRMMDRSRTDVAAHKRDQDRDQDRTKMQDAANMNDQDIYGNALMSNTERNHYRSELGKANMQGSGAEFQTQHEHMMQKRALEQGQDLVPPGQGPVYGGEFMTVQERNEYREQLRLSDSDEDRLQLKAQHRDRIQQRVNALGLEVEEAE
jgi:hypothetical protein